MLVSNPPYIESDKIDKLERQVKVFEDRTALDGGENGVDVVWEVVEKSVQVVAPGGWVVMEVDTSQPPLLTTLLQQYSSI